MLAYKIILTTYAPPTTFKTNTGNGNNRKETQT